MLKKLDVGSPEVSNSNTVVHTTPVIVSQKVISLFI